VLPVLPVPPALLAELELVVVELLELAAVLVRPLSDAPAAGTVKPGAPDVLLVLEPPPPQALTPSASVTAARTAPTEAAGNLQLGVAGLVIPTGRSLRSRAAPYACRSRGSR
jgi:hypothetical protein